MLLLHRRLPGLIAAELLRSLSRTALAALALAAATAPIAAAARAAGLPPPVQTVCAVAAGGAAYAGAAFLLRSPDLQRLIGLARTRLRR